MLYLIQHFLTESFTQRKDMVAVRQGDVNYRYKEIDERSRRYQSYFQKNSFNRIGILSRVRVEAIYAMIGALRAGVVYVPLNTLAPADWIGNVCQNACIDTVLIDSQFYDTAMALKNFGVKRIILLDEDRAQSEVAEVDLKPDDILKEEPAQLDRPDILCDDIAYVLYTSGSTGTPKGILITHRNAFTFIDWMAKEFSINENDRVFSRAPLQFDLSVFDIFTTFMAGGTLVIAPMDSGNKAFEIVSFMIEEKITIVYTVPSAFISWFSKGKLDRGIPSLRQIMYAGEPFPIPFLKKVMSCLPKTKVSNIYGPTETNIVTYFHLNGIEHLEEIAGKLESVPIGKPVHDTEIYIVDENLNKVKPGEIGEIIVRGGTVFAGYFNDSERTKAKLIQSPFHSHPTLCCKTGDLGRFLEDGNIVYHGRADSLIKTRGYRVEIGEVESAMSSIEGINELAVVARPHAKYGNSLHAFVSIKNDTISIKEINSLLSDKIPGYMMPYDITEMETLPRTSTGKIDRVGLSEMAFKDKVK